MVARARIVSGKACGFYGVFDDPGMPENALAARRVPKSAGPGTGAAAAA
jgi:hypothetical protein